MRGTGVLMAFGLTMSSGGFRQLYTPKNTRQQKYMDILGNTELPIVIAEGPAGTGKTALACQTALELLHKNRIKRIVLTRPVISADEGIGFLKGNLNQKMHPWIVPMMDVFMEFYSTDKLRHLFDSRVIEIVPFSFMRGRTFKSSFIIADEIQNATPVQTQMLVTRLGYQSKMILTGDISQSDLKRTNGLEDIINRLETRFLPYESFSRGIAIIRFSAEHIERHPVLQTIDAIYNDDSS